MKGPQSISDHHTEETSIEPPTDDRPIVDVNLAAVCANYRAMRDAAAGATAAAVVKCNGYGLGAIPIARTLVNKEGCTDFYVAHAHEGVTLRDGLRDIAPTATINILHGPTPGTIDLYKRHALTPVLNSEAQCALWQASAGPTAPAILHVDTGMNRLGAPIVSLADIAQMEGLSIKRLISHLSDSTEPTSDHSQNQHRLFLQQAEILKKYHDDISLGLASSGGALMNAAAPFDLAFDEVRLGVGLYGVSPLPTRDPRIRPAATLTAPILQVQTIPKGASVGYGGLFCANRETTIATIALGYGDGFLRSADKETKAFVGGVLCPIAGRVSMDLITLDITEAVARSGPLTPGDRAELFGENLPIEDQAAACGTIGYELLTGLGPRVLRRHSWEKKGVDPSLLSENDE